MKKNSYYLLDGRVRFHADDNRLHSLEGLPSVQLQIPASLCLLTLIEKQGEVVTQANLIMAGWESAYITANTLYQTILHLRRSLEKVGISKEFIKTINRKGLLIQKCWDINYHEDPIVNDATNTSPNGKIIKFTLISIFLSVFITVSYFTVFLHEKAVFFGYSLFQGNSFPANCIMYTKENIAEKKILKTLIKKNNICSEYPVIYISQYKLTNKYSIIACTRNIENVDKTNSLMCKSFYFPETQE